jgi:hypothetical protein
LAPRYLPSNPGELGTTTSRNNTAVRRSRQARIPAPPAIATPPSFQLAFSLTNKNLRYSYLGVVVTDRIVHPACLARNSAIDRNAAYRRPATHRRLPHGPISAARPNARHCRQILAFSKTPHGEPGNHYLAEQEQSTSTSTTMSSSGACSSQFRLKISRGRRFVPTASTSCPQNCGADSGHLGVLDGVHQFGTRGPRCLNPISHLSASLLHFRWSASCS